MDIEIISTEAIKPSFPTPDELRHYKLCSLDQMVVPGAYIPIIFFYPNHHDSGATNNILVDQRITMLKKSLSETLTIFFPLAGTMKDGLSVDCDDRGASFTTAKVNCRLDEFLSQESPDLRLITRLFLPSGGNVTNISATKSNYMINIQATVFEKCGGIALGACISHKLVDGSAMSFFLKSWADINAATSTSELQMPNYNNNNNNNNISPDFSTASSLFPASDLRIEEASTAMWWGCVLKKDQFVTKRFVFDGSSIAAIRNKASADDSTIGNQPTRVESITALIWKCAMEYAASDGIQEKSLSADGGGSTKKPPISLLALAVNLRKRAVPSFSQQSLGNLTWNSCAKITADQNRNVRFPDLVVEVRKCIAKINGEFVEKLLGEEGSSTLFQYLKENFIDEICSPDLEYFFCSSWSKFDLYKIDFGWGEPAWISFRDSSGPFGMNFIVLVDTKSGNGIEAWITLDEQKMALLESNQEFRAFASNNPSPLHST